MHKIDNNDFEYARERDEVIGWVPEVFDDKGNRKFNVTRFVTKEMKYLDVFHVKPVYYQNIAGYIRPLSEVTSWHGNKKIHLNKNWGQIHPQYLNWINTRQGRFEKEDALLIESSLYSEINQWAAKHPVGCTVTTVYPDPDTETSTVDGVGARTQTAGSWDAIHDSTTSNSTYDNLSYLYESASGYGASTRWHNSKYHVGRVFTYFDTSAISNSDTVDSATMDLYGFAKSEGDSDAYAYVSLVQVQGDTIGSDTAVAAGDFNECGDAIDNPTKGATDLTLTSLSTSGYNTWTLNATGLGWIARSGEQKPTGGTAGITYLGFREGHDVEDVAIDGGSSVLNNFTAYAADQTGTSNDPKLAVTHTPSSTFKPKVIIF